MKFSTLLLCFLLSVAGNIQAKEIVIGLGNFQPYFGKNESQGLFSEIIVKAFAKMPEYKVRYVPNLSNKELELSFDKKQLDGIANAFWKPKSGGCVTQPAFRFQDVAVATKKSKIELTELPQLKSYSVVTYENAADFWGDIWTNNINQKRVIEVKDPNRQAMMLFANRVEISIGDLFIFLHQITLPMNDHIKVTDFSYFNLLPYEYSEMAFRENILCDKFDKAIDEMKASGEYEAVYTKYLSKFGID